MEKDIGKIKKNDDTDIILRVDDFGGFMGLTIREFVTSERYTGFTKAGVRIRADKFDDFKEMINSVNPDDLKSSIPSQEKLPVAQKDDSSKVSDSGIGSDGLM